MNAQSVLRNMTARGMILMADGERLDVDAPEAMLTDDVLDTLRKHKSELLALLSTPGRCPICHEPANLQDAARDAWFCPNCRTWCNEQGGPLARIERRKPVTSDEADARKLIDDLRAAGCAFVFDDGELRMVNPARMSAGLWTRFEQAGAEFRRLAREEAEREAVEWEARNEWIN